MELGNSRVQVTFSEKEVYLRSVDVFADGTEIIYWEDYHVDGDSWSFQHGKWLKFDKEEDAWQKIDVIPDFESRYQEALLAQYPFEKRVREIAEKNVGAGEVMFALARDFNFVELVKEYLKKLPR